MRIVCDLFSDLEFCAGLPVEWLSQHKLGWLSLLRPTFAQVVRSRQVAQTAYQMGRTKRKHTIVDFRIAGNEICVGSKRRQAPAVLVICRCIHKLDSASSYRQAAVGL